MFTTISFRSLPQADLFFANPSTNWNSTVGKDDIVFHLGDFAMGGSAEWSRLLERLNGRIYLILGNHDMKTIGKGFSRFEHVAMQMLINIGGQKIYLNHYPFLCYGGAYKNTWQLFASSTTFASHLRHISVAAWLAQ